MLEFAVNQPWLFILGCGATILFVYLGNKTFTNTGVKQSMKKLSDQQQVTILFAWIFAIAVSALIAACCFAQQFMLGAIIGLGAAVFITIVPLPLIIKMSDSDIQNMETQQ